MPKAVTRTEHPGEVRIETGEGVIPRRRFDGWYDARMVTRTGENILSRLDDYGISELRRLKLLWSSWNGPALLEDQSIEWFTQDWGMRKVSPSDPQRLRLFFLSLLWRAAITEQIGFTSIVLSQERLERLRLMVATGDPNPISVFPVTLMQLSTDGGWHNTTPTKEIKTYPDESGHSRVSSFRFYFDGLIVHIDDEETDPVQNRWGNMAIGAGDDCMVLVRPYEGSAQEERLMRNIRDATSDHGELVDSLLKRGNRGVPSSKT
ncbi:hypothetical protein [Rhizobium sp. M1]|uniref:hypothetical protein n=1 Tax=Rhizobium sp. M1 TaxID=2035453 RepID=UPI001141A30E|nr:hypothetical protein [Rhizobium sp. M1]